MENTINHIGLSDGKPAGLFARSTHSGATLSLWVDRREMIASLTPIQAKQISNALTSPNSAIQITGTISEFIAPKFG